MDILDRERLYKLVCARDKRYDGRFYCGVRTTHIYCRPICPARPQLANITFYRSATEAENAGYRACLRCRPDLAPHSGPWHGTAAVVGRALSLIARGEADGVPLEQFARRLGISDRHLRRLFDEHVGASPGEVAASKRLHLARQLLLQSNLPITQTAFAAGFQSLRRFNEAFQAKFHAPPSAVRRSVDRPRDAAANFITVELPVIAPFDWDGLLRFFQNHAVAGVESFAEGRYRRCFSLGDGAVGAVDVGYEPQKTQLTARVYLEEVSHLRRVIEKVRDLFDARLNPHAHVDDLNADDPIAACYVNSLGLRIPGAWEPFETAVAIILGQLVSVEQGRRNVQKLIERFGTKLAAPLIDGCTHRFPEPRELAKADLRTIGITSARAAAIRELARQLLAGRLNLSRTADLEATRKQLQTIPGIGPWTVELIALRCLGDTNAFPATDLIVKRALAHHSSKHGDWSPWNAYVTLALWKKYAASLSRKRNAPPARTHVATK